MTKQSYQETMMHPKSKRILTMMLVTGGLAAALPAAAPPAFAECGADRVDCALKANSNHPCCAKKGSKDNG